MSDAFDSSELTLNGRSLADIGGMTENKEELAELLELFKKTTKKELATLHEAIDAGDLETVRSVAHNLKGVASLLGAGKMSTLCRSMEDAAIDGDAAKVERILDRLAAIAERTRRAMDAKLREAA